MKSLLGARHGLNLSGKLQRIAEQEKALLEKMKTNRSEVFKQPVENGTSTRKAKKRVLDLNSSKDDSSDEEKLPINLDNNRVVSKKKKKKEKKQVNELAEQILSFGLDKSLSQESVVASSQQESVVHQDTPIKKRKKNKLNKRESDELNKIVEEIEQVDEKMVKKKKKKKSKKENNLLDDDETMSDATIKNPDSSQNATKAKRVKIDNDSAAEASVSSDEDIDKINEIHHINLRNTKAAGEELRNKNYESSNKKKKKKKIKVKSSLISDDSWKITHKKIDKYEAKKLKLRIKQEKFIKKEPKLSKKAKKNLKKEAKKEFTMQTDNAVSEMISSL